MTTSTDLRASLQLQRDFFLGGFTVQYDLDIPYSPASQALLDLCERLLRDFLPPEALQQGRLRDVKGRDQNNMINDNIPLSELPRGDELFYLRGSYPVSLHMEEIQNVRSESTREIAFDMAIISKFHSFEGASHILHNAHFENHGAVPEGLVLPHLRGYPEIHITRIRFGLDLFQAHSFAFMGFAPFVGQTVLMEIDQNRLHLRITAERLPSKSTIPLSKGGLFDKLSDALTPFLGLNIKSDYESRLPH